MSRDYKRSEPSSGSRGSAGSLLVGILIGLVLGLSIALGLAWYINKMPSPFLSRSAAPSKPAPKEGAPAAKKEDRLARALPEDRENKPRFDFYKILPSQEGVPSAPVREARPSTGGAREAFFLQAGAFQNAPDADNLKARLALIGVEATIQTTTLADRGTLHRVRVGPYENIEELNRVRDALKQNGYDTTLVKAEPASR